MNKYVYTVCNVYLQVRLFPPNPWIRLQQGIPIRLGTTGLESITFSTPYKFMYIECMPSNYRPYVVHVSAGYCEANSNPCMNGGVCTSNRTMWPYYECKCPIGYYGKHCDSEYSICISIRSK